MDQKTYNLVVLWDIENVTPNMADMLFLDGLFEYVEGLGRVVSSYAYADWSSPAFIKAGRLLASRYFRLIHVPRGRRGKNSADMQLIGDALELIRFYEHIDSYVLITGDSDFRPLLLSLRKSGKRVYIICDVKTAAQDLLVLADSFVDYRELLPTDDDVDQEVDESGSIEINTSRDYWFQRLVEASNVLSRNGKVTTLGPLKLEVRRLNPNFQEKHLGYRRFSDFVMAGVREGYVTIQPGDEDSEPAIHAVVTSNNDAKIDSLHLALMALVEGLKGLDKEVEAQFHNYNQIGNFLRQKGINFRGLGFSQLKNFLQSAETRGLVEIKVESMRHYARLI